jgi:hypothetical protein
MKTTSRIALITAAIAATLSFSSALAAQKYPSRKGSKSVPADMSLANPEAADHTEMRHSGTDEARFGFGFSSIGSTTPGMSGLLNLNSKNALQFIFGINGTSPFTFNTGAYYRFTLTGDDSTGFHLGGGFSLGLAAAFAGGTAFFANLQPLCGFHYRIPHAPVVMSLDGGPTIQISGSSANFGLGAFSQLFGLSAHYLF